jgi:hypothetical protein
MELRNTISCRLVNSGECSTPARSTEEYSTKESAFESAAAAASLAIHQGHEVHISVPSSEDSGAASKAF